MELSFLLLEDNQDHAELFLANLELTSYAASSVTREDSLENGMAFLRSNSVDMAFIDLSLPDSDVPSTLNALSDIAKLCPVVVITSLNDKNTLLEIIERGADDCLPKLELNDVLLERVIRFNHDRWKLKQELVSTQQQYQDLYDHSPEMHVSVDAKTAKILTCNQTLAEKLGCSKENILGKFVFELYHEDSLEGAQQAFEQFSTIGRVENAELQLKRFDGSKIDVLLNATAVRNEHNEITHSRSTWTDITDKKLYERTLKQQEKYIRDIVDNVPQGLVIIDSELKVQAFNQLLHQLLGVPKETIALGGDFLEVLREWIVHTSQDPILYEIAVERLKNDAYFEVEISYTIENQLRWFNLTQSTLPNGSIVRTYTDITDKKKTQEHLMLMQYAFDHVGEAAFLINEQGTFEYSNDGSTRQLEYSKDELSQMSWTDIVSNTTMAEWNDLWLKIKKRGFYTFQVEGKTQAGHVFPAEAIVNYIEYQNKGLVLAFLYDITERKRTEEKLSLLASVFSYTREGIIITDLNNKIVNVNQAFTEVSGYSKNDVIGQDPKLLRSSHHAPEFYKKMWRAIIENGFWQGEISNRKKNGESYVEFLTISTIKDSQGEPCHYLGIFSDITLQKRQQEFLEYHAHFDALTQLPNRLLFSDRLQIAMAHAVRHNTNIAVAFLDLDGFKAINDQFGHEVGDEVLKITAKRLKGVLREEDTIARFGGDEFVAILMDLKEKQSVVPFLSRLLKEITQPLPIDSQALNISSSVGITFFPQLNAINADQLIRQADQAMYQAKVSGKNCFAFFDTEQEHELVAQNNFVKSIEAGLNNHEFELFYQPKVNVVSKEIVGFEALIRWNHPTRGLLRPNQFLPQVSQHPVSLLIDEWVIKTALTQIVQWEQENRKYSISINIGHLLLQQSNIELRFKHYLAGFSSHQTKRLGIEIIETNILDDLSHVAHSLSSLKQYGITSSLDDFGTGYSSLAYLKHLPVCEMKLDKSYVLTLTDTPKDLAIADGVLNLARAFNLTSIAEGVETLEHVHLLTQLGCEIMQGYFFAKPLPVKVLEFWVDEWTFPIEQFEVNPIEKDKVSIIYAIVEHRAWIKILEQYLAGQTNTPPQLDSNKCQFGIWLSKVGQVQFGQLKEFDELNEIHAQVHRLADEILAQNNDKKQKYQLTDLKTASKDLIKKLTEFAIK